MATGDVVSAIGASNAILDFQPAAGVEACITCLLNDINTGGHPVLYNGTSAASMTTDAVYFVWPYNIKMFVNNTNYLRIPAAGVGKISGYCGVQTK